jgi:hypothetical protein
MESLKENKMNIKERLEEQDKINHEVQKQYQSSLKLIVELQLFRLRDKKENAELVAELQEQISKQTDVIDGLIKLITLKKQKI